jgi:hypothetical protein
LHHISKAQARTRHTNRDKRSQSGRPPFPVDHKVGQRSDEKSIARGEDNDIKSNMVVHQQRESQDLQ